jgi:hypothetical protein
MMLFVARCDWGQGPAPATMTVAQKQLEALLLHLRFVPFTLRARMRSHLETGERNSSSELDNLFNSDFMYLAPVK